MSKMQLLNHSSKLIYHSLTKINFEIIVLKCLKFQLRRMLRFGNQSNTRTQTSETSLIRPLTESNRLMMEKCQKDSESRKTTSRLLIYQSIRMPSIEVECSSTLSFHLAEIPLFLSSLLYH
jgi:hypothetical protein